MRMAIIVWFLLNSIFVFIFIYTFILWSVYWRNSIASRIKSGSISRTYRRTYISARLRKTSSVAILGSKLVSNVSYDEKSVLAHKVRTLAQLRRIELSSPLRQADRRYHVDFRANRVRDPAKYSGDRLLCRLKKHVESLPDDSWALKAGDEPFSSQGLDRLLPAAALLNAAGHYNSCVVVSSAGSLRGSSLGNFIDSHDVVVRFNDAPTSGYERDVGSLTSVRVLNSRLVTSAQFDFSNSALFRNVTLVAWDPGRYGASVQQWYEHSDFPIFRSYFERRLMLPDENFHLVSSRLIWHLWDFLQIHTHVRILPHPPSSGFLGIVLMLRQCDTVSVAEYIPSLRHTAQCHYYDHTQNEYCSLGAWHPLATEKQLIFRMNEANDRRVFADGVMSLPGFSQLTCDLADMT